MTVSSASTGYVSTRNADVCVEGAVGSGIAQEAKSSYKICKGSAICTHGRKSKLYECNGVGFGFM
jgi:hypothetical protein